MQSSKPDVPAIDKHLIEINKLLQSKKYDLSWPLEQRDEKPGIKVSAIVSTYNSEKFIKGCLEDLVNQTLYKKGGLEIIVIDSGSQQNEKAIVEDFQQRYKNIIYIRTGHETVYAAWNRGIKMATGKYITNANTDDRRRNDALEVMADVLDRDPGTGLVYADVIITEKENETFDRHTPAGTYRWLDYSRELLAIACFIGPQPMWRKSLHEECGYFNETFVSSGDWEFWLRIAEKTELLHIREPLGLYFRSPQSVEHRNEQRIREDINILNKYIPKYLSTIGDIERGLSTIKELEQNLHGSLDHIRSRLMQQKSLILGQDYDGSRPDEKAMPLPRKNRIPGLASIVILISNLQENIKRCVRSIEKNTPEDHEIIFAPIDFTQAPVKWIRKFLKENPSHRIIESKGKLSFSEACNLGVSESSGEYILLLTDDVVVTGQWLSGMLECMTGPGDAGIVGPMAPYLEGPQGVADPDYLSLDHLDSYAKNFREKNRYRRVAARKLDDFCTLFRYELVDKIGMLDERFDSFDFVVEDYCLRASIEGYRNCIAADVFVHHEKDSIARGKDYTAGMLRSRNSFIEKWSAIDNEAMLAKLLPVNALNRADELNQQGLIDAAAAVLTDALKYLPDDQRLYYVLAEMLLENKKFQEALASLESMPDTLKDDYRKLELIGYCKTGLELNDEAERLADKTLALNSTSSKAWNLKGLIAFKKELYNDAEACFKKAEEFDRSSGEPLASLGALKWITAAGPDAALSREKALNLFEKAFILTPTAESILTNYYTAAASVSQFDRAEKAIKDAVTLHPVNKRLKYTLMDVLILQEKYADAMKEMEGALIAFGMDDHSLSIALALREKAGAKEIKKSGRPLETSNAGTLSLCMIVKNEESVIGQCLMKIKPLVDEMIVVDTGSTDRTKDIAEVFGAKVYDFKWTDSFADARNFSLSKASGRWILILDADEAISSADHETLLKIIRKSGHRPAAYSFVTKNYVVPVNTMGWVANDGTYYKEEAGTGWFPSDKVRLFPNDSRIQFEKTLHEIVEPSLIRCGIEIKKCDVPIHHYGKLNQDKIASKAESYFNLGKKKLAEQGEKDAPAIFEMAIQAAEIGRHEEALEYLKKLIVIAPNFQRAYHSMGNAYINLGRYEDAFSSYKRAFQLDPNSRDTILMYSTCEVYVGDPEKAISLLENFLKKDSTYPLAMLPLAAAYFCTGRKKQGFEYMKILKAKKYQCADYFSKFARVLISIGRYEYAELLLESVTEIMEVNSDTPVLLAESRKLQEVPMVRGTGESDVEFSSPQTLSLCMIVKNEEDNIGQCLQSIRPVVDEIIVVDTGSTDRTMDIAKTFGARVYNFEWTDSFSDARNFSLSKASGRWILILDADEVISPSDHGSLRKLIRESGAEPVAYLFVTRNYIDHMNAIGWVANEGKYPKEEAGTGWFFGEKVRLFPNDSRIRFENPVHELVEPSLERARIKVERCAIPVHHYGKLDKEKAFSKSENYYILAKKKLEEKGEGDINALYEMSLQAIELRKYDEALGYLKKVIVLDPSSPKAVRSIGNIYFNLNRYDEALSYYKRALHLDQGSLDTVLLYSQCEIYAGDASASINALEGLVKRHPSHPLVLFTLAAAYFCAGGKKKGLQIIKKLNEMNVVCADLFYKSAAILVATKRTKSAALLLEAAVESGNTNSDVLALLDQCQKILHNVSLNKN